MPFRTGLESTIPPYDLTGLEEFDLDAVEPTSTQDGYLLKNINQLSDRFSTIDQSYPKDMSGYIDRLTEAGSAVYGQAGKMTGDALGTLGSSVIKVLDFITPDAITDPLMRQAKSVANAIKNSQSGQQAAQIWNTWYGSLQPEEQRKLGDIGNMTNMVGASNPVPMVNPALRGGGLTAASNLIPGKYGASTLNMSVPEQMLVDKVTGLVDKSGVPLKAPQKAALADGLGRVMGFGKWAAEGAKNAVTYYVNPRARALYEETGIGPLTKKLADEFNLKEGSEQELKQLMAQGMYNRHIIKQAGKTGEVSPQMQAIGNFGVLAESTTSKPGVYKELAKPFDKSNLTDADYAAFESHIRKAWPTAMASDANIILKGSSQLSGQHSRDLWHSPVYKTLTKSFKDLEKDPKAKYRFDSDAELRDYLTKYADETSIESDLKASAKHMLKTRGRGGELRRKHFNIIPEDKMTPEMKAAGGVWIVDGFPGTSITEGGVNGIYKVDKNWDVTLVISDEHNYFEKITKPILPNNQMMVSMPFKKNIAMQQLLSKEGKERLGFSADNFGMMGGDASKEAALGIVKGIQEAKPSTFGTVRQASGLFNTYGRPREEE